MSRTSLLKLTPLLLLAPLLGGCLSTLGVGPNAGPQVVGHLELSGPTFGDVKLEPTMCATGEREVFLGADFTDSNALLVARLVVDPLHGPGARIFHIADRFGKALVLKREDCTSFHFTLGRTGWQVDDIYIVTTSLELDCQLPNGDKIQGKLESERCW